MVMVLVVVDFSGGCDGGGDGSGGSGNGGHDDDW